jgi:2-C-methyl-D-erythritol 2,4-cyclodiphosphate synthase
MRVGIGYDFHRFAEDRKLVLGGVVIPYVKGLEGHSDADVLLHAVCDALLGACGEEDIGYHFPSTDPDYKDVSSVELVNKVMTIVKKKGLKVSNVDTIVICEEPKLVPFKETIRQKIAEILDIKKEDVSVKATTTEGLGSIGRGEAIAAQAVVMLKGK